MNVPPNYLPDLPKEYEFIEIEPTYELSISALIEALKLEVARQEAIPYKMLYCTWMDELPVEPNIIWIRYPDAFPAS